VNPGNYVVPVFSPPNSFARLCEADYERVERFRTFDFAI
jgi:hypothetical protein